MSPTLSKRITPRAWFIAAALAITGQIVWAVENSWFNSFVCNTIYPYIPSFLWGNRGVSNMAAWVNT